MSNCEKLALSEEKKEELDLFIDQLYEELEKGKYHMCIWKIYIVIHKYMIKENLWPILHAFPDKFQSCPNPAGYNFSNPWVKSYQSVKCDVYRADDFWKKRLDNRSPCWPLIDFWDEKVLIISKKGSQLDKHVNNKPTLIFSILFAHACYLK